MYLSILRLTNFIINKPLQIWLIVTNFDTENWIFKVKASKISLEGGKTVNFHRNNFYFYIHY